MTLKGKKRRAEIRERERVSVCALGFPSKVVQRTYYILPHQRVSSFPAWNGSSSSSLSLVVFRMHRMPMPRPWNPKVVNLLTSPTNEWVHILLSLHSQTNKLNWNTWEVIHWTGMPGVHACAVFDYSNQSDKDISSTSAFVESR